MSFLKSIFCGRKVTPTEDVLKELIPGEQVLYGVEQARIEQPISPDSIFITTERIMFRGPRWFGLWGKNRDYRYEDMGNVTIRRGLLNSSIHVKMRLLTYDVCLIAIPNEVAPLIARAIQEGLDGRFAHIGSGYSTPDGVQESAPPERSQSQRVPTNDELLSFLKYRYTKGEITRDEYERMKRDIMS